MNTQKYRLFKQLKNAIEADDILAATTRCIWDADGIAAADARCGIPSLQEIQTFTQPVKTDKRFIVGEDTDRYKVVLSLRTEDLQKNVLLTDEEKITLQETLDLCKSIRQGNAAAEKELAKDILPQVLKSICSQDDTEAFFEILNVLLTDKQKAAVRETLDLFKSACQGNVAAEKELAKDILPDDENFHHRFAEYISQKVIELIASGQLAHNESIERILSEILSDRLSDFTNEFGTLPIEMFEPVANHLLRVSGEPSAERLEWLHQAWVLALEQDTQLSHPIVPLVRAWLQEQSAKRITKEYDERHPAAIIKHPFGCVREIAFSTEGIGTIREFTTPESVNQLSLPLIEPESIIPEVVPITFIDINGKPINVLQRTKSGAVAHSIRILFEVIMALRTGDKAPIISIPLGDMIDYLNPDGKFHRKNQLKYIIDGINLLDRAAVPWYDAELKKERLWKFLSVTTPIKYEDSNDTRVFFGVSIPPDTHQGYMIQKEIHRRLGKESAARFHAYHTVCYLWDKYGTHRGKLINPTKPIEARNERGELIHPVTKDLVLTEQGKPMKNLYDTQAVKQLPRTDSLEGINRYPLLSNEDLIKACYPNGYTQTSRRVILKRSKAHWESLEKDGYIVIHRKQNRWRILPPDNHLSTHRAVAETQKRTV